MKTNPCEGGGLDDFLREEGIFEEVEVAAHKRAASMKLADIMAIQSAILELPQEEFWKLSAWCDEFRAGARDAEVADRIARFDSGASRTITASEAFTRLREVSPE